MHTITSTTSRWPSVWRSTSWLSSGESLLISSRATTDGSRAWSCARKTNSTRWGGQQGCFLSYAVCKCVSDLIWSVVLPRMPCSMRPNRRTQSWPRSCCSGSFRRIRRSVSPPASLPATTCSGLTWCWRRRGGTTSWTFPCLTSSRWWGNTSAR